MPDHFSAEEKKVFEPLFRQADPSRTGHVSGDTARSLFMQSGLPLVLLGQIWQLVDPNNQGYLDEQGFYSALRVIGYVQAGSQLSSSLAESPGPLPFFGRRPTSTQTTGVSAPPPATPTAAAPAAAPPASSGLAIPPIPPQENESYRQLFLKNAPNGFLEGGDARNIFMKSRLSTDALIQVWNLADTKQRGKLDESEFALAMHLIRCLLVKSISQLPSTLPPGLLESIKQSSAPAPAPNSNSGPPRPPAPRALTRAGSINSPPSQQYPQVTSPRQLGAAAAPRANAWVITPQERAQSDAIFDSIDKARRGTIGAEEVVPFLTKSNLPEDVLAQVWDLADVNNTGVFSKTEFSIAMYLIQQKLAGRDLPSNLPQTLLQPPASQITSPSFGHQAQLSGVPVQGTGTGFQGPPIPPKPAPQTQPSSASAPAPALFNNSGSLKDLVSLGDSFVSPQPTNAPSGTGNAFIPTSSFGQSLITKDPTPAAVSSPPLPQQPNSAPIATTNAFSPPPAAASSSAPLYNQPTATSAATAGLFGAVAGATVAAVASDPFGRPDELDNRLSNTKTDLANVHNQVNSMSSQADKAREKREKTEAELNRLAGVRAELETKLTTLRATRDKDIKQYEQLDQLLHKSQLDTGKLSQDYSVLEAQSHELQTKVQEATTKYNTEREQNVQIKEKIKQVNEQIVALKTQLEGIDREAKQQNNYLNISKQQLATVEQERDGYQTQIQSLHSQIVSIQEEIASNNQKLEAAKQHVLQHEQAKQQLLAQQRALETQRAQQEAQQAALPRLSTTAAAATAVGVAGAAGAAIGAIGSSVSSPSSNTQLASGSTTAESPAHSSSSNPFFQYQNPSNGEQSNETSGSFDDRFRQIGFDTRTNSVADATTATNRSLDTTTVGTDTANTSPNSEFTNNGGIINGFRLPLSRTQSTSSSVQNNPSLSVRGDLDAPLSRSDSPIDAQSPSSPVTSEHVAGMAPPDDLEIRAIQNDVTAPNSSSGVRESIPVSVAATVGSSIPDSANSVAGSAPELSSGTGHPAPIPGSVGPVAITSAPNGSTTSASGTPHFEYADDRDRMSSGTESYEMVPRANDSSLSLSDETPAASSIAPPTSFGAPPVSFPSDSVESEGTVKDVPRSAGAESSSASSKDSEFKDAETGRLSSAGLDSGIPGALPGTAPEFSGNNKYEEDEGDSSSDDDGPEFLPGHGSSFYPRTTSSQDPFSSTPAIASAADAHSDYSVTPLDTALQSNVTLPSSSVPVPAAAPATSSTIPAPVPEKTTSDATFASAVSPRVEQAPNQSSDFDNFFPAPPQQQQQQQQQQFPSALAAGFGSDSFSSQINNARSDSVATVPHFGDPEHLTSEAPDLPPKGASSGQERNNDPFAIPQQQHSQPAPFDFGNSGFPSDTPDFPSNPVGFPSDTSNFPSDPADSFPTDSFPSDNVSNTQPVSNDEWESLFASFSSPNGAVAPAAPVIPPPAAVAPVSQREIEDAFSFAPIPPPPPPSKPSTGASPGVTSSTGSIRGPQPPLPLHAQQQQQQQQSQQPHQSDPQQFQQFSPSQNSPFDSYSHSQSFPPEYPSNSGAGVRRMSQISTGPGSGTQLNNQRAPVAAQNTGPQTYSYHQQSPLPSGVSRRSSVRSNRQSNLAVSTSRTGTFNSLSEQSPTTPNSGSTGKKSKNPLSFMYSSKDDKKSKRSSIVPNLIGFGKHDKESKKRSGKEKESHKDNHKESHKEQRDHLSPQHQDDLFQLTSMGFSTEKATKALVKNKYDVEASINYLLERT